MLAGAKKKIKKIIINNIINNNNNIIIIIIIIIVIIIININNIVDFIIVLMLPLDNTCMFPSFQRRIYWAPLRGAFGDSSSLGYERLQRFFNRGTFGVPIVRRPGQFPLCPLVTLLTDRKSTRLNSSHRL